MPVLVRTLVLVGAVALLGAAAAAPAGARFQGAPVVDIQSNPAGLAPDGSSMTVAVLASCPERWAVVEAVVRVSQPGASGQASFPLTCIGSVRPFSVTVPASGGAFQLGSAQVSASVVIQRGTPTTPRFSPCSPPSSSSSPRPRGSRAAAQQW